MSNTQKIIAHILPWPNVGGTEQATLRIARAVEGPEFRNIFFHLEGATSVKDLFNAAGFETISYRAVEPSYSHPKVFLQESFQRSREFARRKVDLVHCSDILAAHWTAVSARMARIPVLCHVRNRADSLSRRDQSFLRAVNKFAFVSADTWKHFAYKIPAHRGTIIYDGIDTDGDFDNEAKQSVRREFAIPETSKIIGMVARIAPQKDYATLIKAAARVVRDDPTVRFFVVGDYAQSAANTLHYEEVKRMLTEQNMSSYFIFTGFRKDVPRLISAMDVFVLSTHHEGLPLVLLEGMAQSKPVIATDVDGIPELVIDGETGLLHEHENDEQLAAHILSLLGNKTRAAALAQAGRDFVKTNFTNKRFAENMVNLYREMLGVSQTATRNYAPVHNSLGQFEGN